MTFADVAFGIPLAIAMWAAVAVLLVMIWDMAKDYFSN